MILAVTKTAMQASKGNHLTVVECTHKFDLLAGLQSTINDRTIRTDYRQNGRPYFTYRGADKSLARPTSRCTLFNGENISFDASLVIYINSTNIPPIMIINRIYETQNLLSL